jgi:hypothetical protein
MTTTSEGFPVSEEDLKGAYVTNNVVTSEILIDAEIGELEASLEKPNVTEALAKAKIQRLASIKETVATLIVRHEIEEPIDRKLVKDLGIYIGGVEEDYRYYDQAPKPEVEAVSIASIVGELKLRNQDTSQQAA